MIIKRPFALGLIATLVSTLSVSHEAKADSFSRYTDLISMQCMGERGVIQFTVEGNLISILDDDPMMFEVNGQEVKKNGNKQQYLISLGFIEYFLDFEDTRAVINAFGMKQELQCF